MYWAIPSDQPLKFRLIVVPLSLLFGNSLPAYSKIQTNEMINISSQVLLSLCLHIICDCRPEGMLLLTSGWRLENEWVVV